MNTIWVEIEPSVTAGYSVKSFREFEVGYYGDKRATGRVKYEYPSMSATELRGMSYVIDKSNRNDATSG